MVSKKIICAGSSIETAFSSRPNNKHAKFHRDPLLFGSPRATKAGDPSLRVKKMQTALEGSTLAH